MTLYNPRALADKLEGLVPELQRWSHRAVMVLDDAQIQQKRIEDKYLQASHSAQMRQHQLVQDQECVQQDEVLLQACEKKCQETLAKAQQAACAAQSTLNEAQTTYDRKQQALQSAREALARAEQALEQSRQTNVYSQARWAVKAASAHVVRCTKAVAFASQALQLAETAHQQAQAGLKASEDSIGFVRATSKALDLGRRMLGQEEAAVNATLEGVQHAELMTQESATQLAVARLHEQPAQQHTSDTLRILQTQMELLIAMNRPELDGLSDTMTAASLQLAAVAGTGGSAPAQYPRIEWLLAKLEEVDGLKLRQWKTLDTKEREEVLQHAHNVIAAVYRFEPGSVRVTPLPSDLLGRFLKETEDIEMNKRLVESSDYIEMLKTIVHESRHAYQWHLAKHFLRGWGWHSDADWTMAQVWSDSFERPNAWKYQDRPTEVDAYSFENAFAKLLFGK